MGRNLAQALVGTIVRMRWAAESYVDDVILGGGA